MSDLEEIQTNSVQVSCLAVTKRNENETPSSFVLDNHSEAQLLGVQEASRSSVSENSLEAKRLDTADTLSLSDLGKNSEVTLLGNNETRKSHSNVGEETSSLSLLENDSSTKLLDCLETTSIYVLQHSSDIKRLKSSSSSPVLQNSSEIAQLDKTSSLPVLHNCSEVKLLDREPILCPYVVENSSDVKLLDKTETSSSSLLETVRNKTTVSSSPVPDFDSNFTRRNSSTTCKISDVCSQCHSQAPTRGSCDLSVAASNITSTLSMSSLSKQRCRCAILVTVIAASTLAAVIIVPLVNKKDPIHKKYLTHELQREGIMRSLILQGNMNKAMATYGYGTNI